MSTTSLPVPPPAPGTAGGAPIPIPAGPIESESSGDKMVLLKAEEEKLLDMLEEVRTAGGAPDNGFKMKTYREIAEAIKGLGPSGSKAKDGKGVENRWKKMKAVWREVRDILAQSGFGWNDEDECVEAEASVWDAYVEKNTKAKKWRRRSCWYFSRVSEICSEGAASGEFSADPALGKTSLDGAEGDDEGDEDDEEGILSAEETKQRAKDAKGKKRSADAAATPTRAPKTPKRRSGSDQMDKMIEVLSDLAAADSAEASGADNPIQGATQALLEEKSLALASKEVARLIGFFSLNEGSARAYVTLVKASALEVRAAYLQQVLASLSV